MTMGGNMGQPKMFGEVGLGISQLKEDVKEAKQQLSSLAKEAKSLGEIFDKLGVANGLGDISTGLEKTKKSIKKVTEDIAREYTDGAKKVAQARQKVVEAISHNYSFGHISPEQAHQQLKEYVLKQKQMLGYQDFLSKKRNDGMSLQETNPNMFSSFNSEIVKAEALMKRVWDNWQKTQQANAKIEKRNADQREKNLQEEHKVRKAIQKEEEKQLNKRNGEYKKQAEEREKVLKEEQKIRRAISQQEEKDRKQSHNLKQKELKELVDNTRKSLKAQLDLEKERYRQGEIDMIQYLTKLKNIERKGMGVFTDADMTRLQRDRMRVDADYQKMVAKQSAEERVKFERDYARISKELVDGVIHYRKMGYASDLQQHREYIQRMLQDQSRFTKNDLKRLQLEWKSTNDLIRKEDLSKHKAYNREIIAHQEKAFGNAEQRFKSLTNYAFDATIIYGSIEAVRNMTQAIREIEEASVGLQRVLPQQNADRALDTMLKESIVEDLRKEAFEVARLTGQSVADVQKLQNLWARASDEIANSKEAMETLTRVSATAMQVGGFEDADEAVTLLNGTLNQMELHWTEAERVMNSWIKTADISAVGSAKDLADMISRVGTQAKMMGLTYHDLNAMVAMYANNMSRSGKEIGTAMKTVFSYFEDDRTIATMEKYGVEVRKNAKEFHNFGYIMEQLSDTFNRLELDNNTQAIAELSEALGRIRRRDYVGVLLNHWNETKDVVQDSLNALKEGWADTQQALMTDTFDHHINELKVSFQELAWSIGEAGLLEDLKLIVSGLADLTTWFANLDPVIKSGLMRLIEFSSALFLVSKGMQVMAGTGLVNLLANATARMAVFVGSQNMLNLAVKAGQTAFIAETTALTANTVATQANATAQAQKNVVDSQGNVITSAETATLSANTSALGANTVATNANAKAQLTLSNAQRVGAGTGGLLAGSIAGLMNPITAVIGVLGIAFTGWTMYKQAQKQAREESEKMIVAQQALKDILAQKVVDDFQIPDLEKQADEIDKARKRFEEAKNAMDEFNEAIQYYNEMFAEHGVGANALLTEKYGKGISELKASLGDIRSEYNESEKALKQLGTSSDAVYDDLAKLNALIVASSDSLTRNAYATIEKINRNHDFNETIRQQVEEYEELIAITNRTRDEELALNSVIESLQTVFPLHASAINKVTGKREIDTEAIMAQIGAVGQLSEAQQAEIQTTIQLDEATKQASINIIKAEIEQTEAKRKATIDRISFMEKEMKSLSDLLGVNNLLNKELSKASLTSERIAELKASGDVPYMISDDAVYSYLEKNNKLSLIGGQASKEVTGLDTSLKELRATLKVLEGIKPFDPKDWDSPLADGDSGGSAEKYNALVDFHSDRLEEINSLLSIMKSELDLIDDTEENRAKRMEMINKIRDLEIHKVEVLKKTNTSLGNQLADVNSQLEKYMSGWTKMDGDQKLTALNRLTEDQKSKINALLSSYQKLTQGIRGNKEEIASTQVVIKEYLDTLEQMSIEGVGNQFNRRFSRDNAIADWGIAKIEREIGVVQRYLDALEDSEENRSKQLEYNLELVDKEVEKNRAITDQRKQHNETLKELNQSIGQYVDGWANMSADEKVRTINNLTDAQRSKLSPILDLWQKITDEVESLDDTLAQSNKNLASYQSTARSIIEAEYRRGLELEKQVSHRRLLAKHEQEELALQRQIFGMTLEAYEYNNQAKIDAKQREIEQLEEEIKLRERNNRLQEIEEEMAKVKADTRFAYIDEATGRETYTYDRARFKELEKQRSDLLQDKDNDDRRTRLQKELQALNKQSDELKKVYDKQLNDLKRYQQYEIESFEEYWRRRQSDEAIQQYVMESIRAQGYNTALKNTNTFMENNKSVLESYNQPMYETGKSLNASLISGLSADMDKFIAQKSQEMMRLGQAMRASFNAGFGGAGGSSGGSIVVGTGGYTGNSSSGSSSSKSSSSPSVSEIKSQMASNSAQWHTASPEQRKQLEQANQSLGKSIGASYDAKSGTWSFPTYHVGGFVGGKPLNPIHEEIAKLLKGEFVMTPPMLDKLSMALRLPDLKFSSPQLTASTTLPSGRSTIIHINKVEANNFEEFMRSIDPYIASQS